MLTYPAEDGNPLINIADYFERFVKPLSSKFANSSFLEHRTVVCPFHDDINPSLGTINHKHLKGVRVYHCFGCNASGTVIRMHQRIQWEYHKRRLSDTEAAIDLCKLYGVDYSSFDKKQYTGNQIGYMQRLERVRGLTTAYTVRELAEELMPVREDTYKEGKMLDLDVINERAELINNAIIKYMITKKELN